MSEQRSGYAPPESLLPLPACSGTQSWCSRRCPALSVRWAESSWSGTLAWDVGVRRRQRIGWLAGKLSRCTMGLWVDWAKPHQSAPLRSTSLSTPTAFWLECKCALAHLWTTNTVVSLLNGQYRAVAHWLVPNATLLSSGLSAAVWVVIRQRCQPRQSVTWR